MINNAKEFIQDMINHIEFNREVRPPLSKKLNKEFLLVNANLHQTLFDLEKSNFTNGLLYYDMKTGILKFKDITIIFVFPGYIEDKKFLYVTG